MGGIGLILLFTTAFMFLMGFLFVKYAQFLVKVMVSRKHEEAEHIIATESIPPRWRQGIFGLDPLAPVARRRAMRRINVLIRYFERTPMVEDDAARSQVINALTETRSVWRGMGWQEILENRRF